VSQAAAFLPFGLFLYILPFPGTVALRLLCLAAAFMLAMYFWRNQAPPAFPAKWAISCWIGVALISIFFAVDSAYSLGELKNEVGYALMAAVAFFVYCNDESRLRWGCLSVLASLVTLATWALSRYAMHGHWNDAAGHGGIGMYTTYMLMFAPILAVAWHVFPKWKWGIVLLGALAVTSAAYARQRAFWPVLGVEVLLFWWLVTRRAEAPVIEKSTKRLAGIGVVLAVVALTVAMLVATQENRVTLHGGGVALENDGRLKLWPNVVSTVIEHPLIGAGFGRNAMKLGYPELLSSDDPNFWHAHNVFLNYGLAMGFPGILTLIFLFSSLLAGYWRLARSEDDLNRVIGAAGSMLVVAVVLRNFTNDFFQRDVALFFWAVNGMFFGYALRREIRLRGPAG
jgi:O-antigen ligase